jgi:hypothetical protein
MHAVLSGVAPLFAIGRRRIIISVYRRQPAREIVDDPGNVVIEGAARETRAGRKLGITVDRLPPKLQEMLASLSKVGRQGIQLPAGRRCRDLLRAGWWRRVIKRRITGPMQG